MSYDCLAENFYQRVHLGSPFPAKEQNDEDVPPAPRSNGKGGRVIGDGGSEASQLRYHGQRRSTIGVIVAVDLERGATSGEILWSIK